MSLAGGLLTSVRVDTAHLPPIVADGGKGDGGFDAGRLLARLLKPKVTATTAAGPVSWAPEGEPGESSWPLLGVVLVLVGWLAVLGAAALFRGAK